MEFPAEMLVEYVRVYQRKGQTNIGCDPPNFPTANYIQNHLDTYSSAYPLFLSVPRAYWLTPCRATDPNLTAFNHPVPKNGLVSVLSPLLLAAVADADICSNLPVCRWLLKPHLYLFLSVQWTEARTGHHDILKRFYFGIPAAALPVMHAAIRIVVPLLYPPQPTRVISVLLR